VTSFLDELRGTRATVLANATKTLSVPGSGGRLGVRFRPPPDRDDLNDVVSAYKVSGALSAEQEKQLIIDCCDELLRRSETGEWEPADPGGGPLRFDAGDERWGPDVSTARECVAKLYNLDAQPLALAGQADVLVDWLQGIDAEVAARAEGKPDSDDAS
jgi:hypothetical protein